MSNSNINPFRRPTASRFGLCHCDESQLLRDQSTQAFVDCSFTQTQRKKLSISGTLRNSQKGSLKKKASAGSGSSQPSQNSQMHQLNQSNLESFTKVEASRTTKQTLDETGTKENSMSRINVGDGVKRLESKGKEPVVQVLRFKRQEVIRRQQVASLPPPPQSPIPNLVLVKKPSPPIPKPPAAIPSSPTTQNSWKCATIGKASVLSKQTTCGSLNSTGTIQKGQFTQTKQPKQPPLPLRRANTFQPRQVESLYGDSDHGGIREQSSLELDSSRQIKKSEVLSRISPEFGKFRVTRSTYEPLSSRIDF